MARIRTYIHALVLACALAAGPAATTASADHGTPYESPTLTRYLQIAEAQWGAPAPTCPGRGGETIQVHAILFDDPHPGRVGGCRAARLSHLARPGLLAGRGGRDRLHHHRPRVGPPSGQRPLGRREGPHVRGARARRARLRGFRAARHGPGCRQGKAQAHPSGETQDRAAPMGAPLEGGPVWPRRQARPHEVQAPGAQPRVAVALSA